MASVAWEGKRAKLVWRDAAGRQKALRLGRCSETNAAKALAGFERVLEAHRLGSTLHPDGVSWLARLDDRIYARIVRLGVGIEPRKAAAVVTLGTLLARFVETGTVRPSTRAAYRQATGSLRDYFGEGRALDTIKPADADDWRKSLADSGLAAATVAKRVKVSKSVFRRAVRWGLVKANPFEELRAGAQSNPERTVYVGRDTIAAVLAACPDNEWRAIIALVRFAGLRCPSEVGLLRWGDIAWDKGRMTVRSPKTAGHEGHAVRVVPIPPELRPILQDLFDRAEPGSVPVIPRLSGSAGASANLRTHFLRIIARAGVEPWPRLFHNLRASCATDWVERFPAHVVAAWLGHSPVIAARHYLHTRDAHFDLAAGVGERSEKASTKASTHTRPSEPTGEHDQTQDPENPAVLVGCGVGCDPLESEKVGAAGLEPATSAM